MTSAEHVGGLDWAFQELIQGDDVNPQAIRLLVDDTSPTVDSRLLSIFHENEKNFKVAALVSRLLVERNPDRDPSFLHEHFALLNPATKRSRKLVKITELGLSYPPPGAHRLGFSRLRQIQPVQVYSGQLEHRFFVVRVYAATALGDTGDLAALEPLARALSDRNWRVRASAADSVRRLRHAGAATVLATHPVRERLINCIADRHRKVRLAASRALVSMSDTQPVRGSRSRLGWWAWRRRRDLDDILRGKIPPLQKEWAGDETT